MNLETFDHSQNYTATIIKLPVKQAVQGLDNLVEVNVFGNSCLVGKDSDPNALYLFFPSGTQLSEAFVKGNNLYRESQLNADINEKGFFEINRRVKAIKFRGIISTGFVIPVWSVNHTAGVTVAEFKEGESFNSIDGVEICRKYVISTPQVQGPKGDKVAKINNCLTELLIPNQFRFHDETNHLANNLGKFNEDDIIVITDKWHGSSCILSNVLIAKKLSVKERILNFFGAKIPAKDYGYIYSSGKPKSNLPKGIEGEWINDGPDFYNSNIWKRAFDDHKFLLEKGISLYGELVGFTKEGSYIQKGYDYGCVADKTFYKFVVYRITYTKSDGNVIEFSWQQIKDYCEKYNILTVPEGYYGRLKDFLTNNSNFPDQSTAPIDQPGQALLDILQPMIETYCPNCVNKVPCEGVVVRIDGKQHYSAYKLKSKLFLKKESDDLDKGETNIEDNA